MKKFYFIRHGESEFNVARRYAGTTDTPLTDLGREQAKKTGQTMRADGIHIDAIISSPLSRALDTAKIVAMEIGYPEDKIIIDKRVIERNFGKLEGKQWSPDHTDAYKKSQGGESETDLVTRMRPALDWIEGLPYDNILVVSHGATGRALRSLIKEDFPMSHPHKLDNARLYEWL